VSRNDLLASAAGRTADGAGRRLRLPWYRSLPPGTHDVEVELGLRIPYLLDQETGGILQLRPRARASVTVPRGAAA